MGWDDAGRIRHTKVNRISSLSNEQGTIIKDWGGRLPISLVYPNSYFIGMSNLGIHAIYKFLNNYNDVVCERVFQSDKNVLSLESKRPLLDFAVVAFSISYELDYFNVVDILKRSNIPLYASERGEHHPLLIAGGACITANPMSLAPFFDCLCIGEAESILPELLSALSHRADTKETTLEELAKLQGVYVPRYHVNQVLHRQWLKNLDDFMVCSSVVTADTELGNLYLLEVGRGCNWSCRFCLVSRAFCPARYHSIDRLSKQASKGLEYRKRIGLVGPMFSDHPQIGELFTALRYMGADISLSSLRIKPLSEPLLDEIARGGIQTVTLAPEAGSQRLRHVMGKKISQDDILKAVASIVDRGMKRFKLYFMIGLPSETDDDIEKIISLSTMCKQIIEKGGVGSRLSLNIDPFVPKAGTPFQWLPMADIPTLKHRLDILKRGLLPKGIKLRSESVSWSHVQAALARGDTKIAGVLTNIEEVTLAGWRKAVDKCHLNLAHYVLEKWDINQDLPWDNIELGSSKEHLISELNKAMASARLDKS
ncbi:MAG: radical SAM protein [Dehalococcoidia bacterium]|nr:MAG: radical SAM protein [Dehalococcoidia bacterium]